MKKLLLILLLVTAIQAELSGNSEQFGNHGNVKYQLGMNTFTVCTYRLKPSWINKYTIPGHILGPTVTYRVAPDVAKKILGWFDVKIKATPELRAGTAIVGYSFHEIFFDGFGNKAPYPSSMQSDLDGFDMIDFCINVWVVGLNYLIDLVFGL